MAAEMNRKTQLVVIGAGPGGYAAAFAAADKGMDVAMVEVDEEPGGVCLNRGCIPSKTLLHIAKLLAETEEAAEMGVTFDKPSLDLDGIRKWKNNVIGKNAQGVRQLAKARNVEIIKAWATFKDAHTLNLSSVRNGEGDLGTLSFDYAIIAVGSRPTMIPAFDIGSDRVMDSTAALDLPEVPKSLLVVGGGYIGLEMGTVYHALGSEVSVVEMTDGLLPGADRDLVRVLQARLKKQFKEIMLDTKVVQMDDTGDAVAVTFDSGGSRTRVEKYDRVLISVGRMPNGKSIGLENTDVVVTDRGFIEHDDQQRTAEQNIFVIGDVAGEPMLAHKASYEAKIAVEVILGEPATFDARAIPAVVFTDPEVAWTGLTENEAKKEGIDIAIAKFPWGASGRATAIGRNDGLTKIIIDPDSKRVLGTGIVGVGAGELIAEAVLAIEMGATAGDIGRSIHAHPTLSETVGEGAELGVGTTTHIFRPPR